MDAAHLNNMIDMVFKRRLRIYSGLGHNHYRRDKENKMKPLQSTPEAFCINKLINSNLQNQHRIKNTENFTCSRVSILQKSELEK